MNNFQLFTVSEVAGILKVNKNFVYELIKYGHLKAMKLGSMKISYSEVQRFVEESQGKDFSDMENVTDIEPKEAC